MAKPPPHPPTKHVALAIDLKFALPWHQDCYQGIMRYGEEHGWRCTLDQLVAGVYADLSSQPYDGVIGRISDEVASRVLELGLPMVNLRKHTAPDYESPFNNLPGVYIDRDAAIRSAIEHLAQNGYRRVSTLAMLADDHRQVLEAADAACRAEGLQQDEPLLFRGDFADSLKQYIDAVRGLHDWLGALPKPVGLVVIHPNLARLVAHVCLERGWRVPNDVGIITPVGDRVLTTSAFPEISAVEFDHHRQGYEAAAMLDKLMSGSRVDPLQTRLPPARLVVRDSTDVFLCDDTLVSQTMRYIAAHIREELTGPKLAEAMGVSSRTLYRRFEEALGRSVHDEVRRLRLDFLKRLLSETKIPITRLSDECGFSTTSHFSRFFKHQTGETPNAYRKRHHAQPSGK